MEQFGDCFITYDADVETLKYDWGTIHLLGEQRFNDCETMTLGSVHLNPGMAHERHNHPNADEYIYVMSGTGEQMLDDNPPVKVGPGANIYIPRGVFHSTRASADGPMHLLVVYAPSGEENVLRGLPGLTIIPPANG